MRIGLLLVLGLTFLIVGGTCLPLVDRTTRTPVPGTSLAIELLAPADEKTVTQGTAVRIEWTAANLTGQPATVSLILESRADLSRTVLVEGCEVTGTGDSGQYNWDTQGFSGAYSVIVRIATPESAVEAASDGLITIDPPPTFEFTAPSGDVEFRAGDDALTISWFGGDNSATAQIGLDLDSDHKNENEVFIAEPKLSDPAAADSIDWEGNDVTEASVDSGTYYLFAIVSDGVNPELIVEGAGQITVAGEDETGGLTVTEPDEDVQFLASDDPLKIEFEVDLGADALVDLKIDTDDNHTNGNELTILSQRLVEKDATPEPFEWNGTDAGGSPVPYGIYRVFAVASTGEGLPATAEAKGLVFRRSSEHQALIALLEPGTTLTVNPGDYVTIRWRDEDPSDQATIRLTVQQDPDLSGASEPREGIEILAGREAKGDGVQDTFAWQVPSSLAPGTYHVFAYIDRDGADPVDNLSKSPAPLVVADPANP